jgi:hypothetical protein
MARATAAGTPPATERREIKQSPAKTQKHGRWEARRGRGKKKINNNKE